MSDHPAGETLGYTETERPAEPSLEGISDKVHAKEVILDPSDQASHQMNNTKWPQLAPH